MNVTPLDVKNYAISNFVVGGKKLSIMVIMPMETRCRQKRDEWLSI